MGFRAQQGLDLVYIFILSVQCDFCIDKRLWRAKTEARGQVRSSCDNVGWQRWWLSKQGDSSRGGGRGLDSGYILKVKLIGFPDRLVWDVRDRGQLGMTPDFMA